MTCSVEKELCEFPPRSNYAHGVGNKCSPCLEAMRQAKLVRRRAHDRARRAIKPHKMPPLKAREYYIQRMYGIGLAEYDDMMLRQGGVCAICFGVNANGNRLCVDHCHTTGRVRGLLCRPCNQALGLLRDSKQQITNALAYLGEHTYFSAEVA